MRVANAFLPVVSLISAIGICVSQAHAAGKWCASGSVFVQSADEAEIPSACDAASNAISFLRENGVRHTRTITINVVETMPDHIPEHYVGCYDKPSDQIYILKKASLRIVNSDKRLFSGASDEEYYRSLIAHEVAHAIVAQNCLGRKLPWTAEEYVAFVAQLTALSKDTREKFIQRFDDREFVPPREINSYLLLMAPKYFAASAYRHFMQLEDRAEFLRQLLAGTVNLNHEGPPVLR